ncbi:hypothetical protein QLQ12_23605 [Actinoplanes sp. NEAU-A12]|uniref:Uncharacterized protein n=1 Tax=Actinoplanes sandaracinus TaxID=3045177 RepID=A0ABT6WPE1_9ACTN|nr:hypothetical protein [Actinoplanes sandaracinus]MDI6101611.1 hypothetical protein [Actinoplanes sandaracinus]
MAYDEHDHPASEGGLYASSTAANPQRSAQRRKQAAVGVAGAVAVLAGAGFLVTQLMNEQQPSLPEPAALAPRTAPVTGESTPEETEPPVTRTPKIMKQAAPVERSPAPSVAVSREASPDPGQVLASAAAGGLRERLGLGGGARVTERTEILGDGSIRIMSARRDMSGERPLTLAADDGEPAGDGVRCTSEIRHEADVPSAAPATLLCWRTSASRSVITVASASEDDSLTAESVEVITREWARLN